MVFRTSCCRKRRLNRRTQMSVNRFSWNSKCGTIPYPFLYDGVNSDQRSNFCSPSQAIVTSLYMWNIPLKSINLYINSTFFVESILNWTQNFYVIMHRFKDTYPSKKCCWHIPWVVKKCSSFFVTSIEFINRHFFFIIHFKCIRYK